MTEKAILIHGDDRDEIEVKLRVRSPKVRKELRRIDKRVLHAQQKIREKYMASIRIDDMPEELATQREEKRLLYTDDHKLAIQDYNDEVLELWERMDLERMKAICYSSDETYAALLASDIEDEFWQEVDLEVARQIVRDFRIPPAATGRSDRDDGGSVADPDGADAADQE